MDIVSEDSIIKHESNYFDSGRGAMNITTCTSCRLRLLNDD